MLSATVSHKNFYPFLYIVVRFTNFKICCLQQVLSQTILGGETSKYRKYVMKKLLYSQKTKICMSRQPP